MVGAILFAAQCSDPEFLEKLRLMGTAAIQNLLPTAFEAAPEPDALAATYKAATVIEPMAVDSAAVVAEETPEKVEPLAELEKDDKGTVVFAAFRQRFLAPEDLKAMDDLGMVRATGAKATKAKFYIWYGDASLDQVLKIVSRYGGTAFRGPMPSLENEIMGEESDETDEADATATTHAVAPEKHEMTNVEPTKLSIQDAEETNSSQDAHTGENNETREPGSNLSSDLLAFMSAADKVTQAVPANKSSI